MNKRMNVVMKMHLRDKWNWFIVPLIIVFLSFGINLVTSSFVSEPIYTGGLASIFIYIFVMGIVSLAQTFPFALGLNLTRKEFFAGTMATALLSSAVLASIMLIFSVIEHDLFYGWGSELFFFHLPYLNDGTLLEQIWIYLSVMVHMYYFGFVISSVYRRFGKAGLFVLAILALLAVTIFLFSVQQMAWWDDIFNWIAKHTAAGLATWVFPLTLIYMFISYMLLRRSTV